jgi:hypothetical protein
VVSHELVMFHLMYFFFTLVGQLEANPLQLKNIQLNTYYFKHVRVGWQRGRRGRGTLPVPALSPDLAAPPQPRSHDKGKRSSDSGPAGSLTPDGLHGGSKQLQAMAFV